MGKSSKKMLEEKRLKEREKKRKQREKMKQDVEAREKFRQKERENYKKRKESGKIKLISDLTSREQRLRRKNWRKRQEKCRQKKKALKKEAEDQLLLTLTSHNSTSIVEDKRKLSGRKRVRKERSSMYRSLKKSEEEVHKYKARSEKLKKRLQRIKKKYSDSGQASSPRTKVSKLLRYAPKKEIRKKLLFGEVLVSELAKSSSQCVGEKEKRKFANIISGKIIKKYRLLKETKKFFNERQKQCIGSMKITRKPKENKISEQIEETVVNFFEDDDNSSLTPGKKDFVTKNKLKKKKRILNDSLKNLHKKFTADKPEIKLSYSTFCKLKPFWIVHPKVSARDTCMCTKHANYQFLIDKLHYHKLIKVNNVSNISDLVCCKKTSYECMYRECSRCKNKILPIHAEEYQLNETTFFYMWCTKTEDRLDKNGKTITVKLTTKEKVLCNIEHLIKEAQAGLVSFLKHSYNWWHQYNTLNKELKLSLSTEEILIVVDFSENYICKYSEEVQSTHFGASKHQITLHTGVIYSNTDSQIDKSPAISFCTVSDSLRHDAYAVWAHIKPILETIKNEFPNVSKIHFQSDGPATQYRNRINMFFLAHFAKEFKFQNVTWNFTESGHGKGPADGIGGTIKRTADQSIAFGTDIKNAKEMIEVLNTKKLNIKLIEIHPADIENIKKLKSKGSFVAIPHAMQLHQVTWDASETTKLNLRSLSCFTCDYKNKCNHFSLDPAFINIEPAYAPASHSSKHQIVDAKVNNSAKVNDWVAILYNDIWYPGCVEDKKDNVLTINFMKRSGKNKFLWPNRKDVQTVRVEDILCHIKPPHPVSSRYFGVENMEEINDLVKINDV